MAQEERYGTRDLTYSAWHRRNSIKRFVGSEIAQLLHMIDLDADVFLECDDRSRETLALIEVGRDVGQPMKHAIITQKLAMRCEPLVPAYVLLYRHAEAHNPADPTYPDIDRFRVKRVWPEPESRFTQLSPCEWAQRLVHIRRKSANLIDRCEYPDNRYQRLFEAIRSLAEFERQRMMLLLKDFYPEQFGEAKQDQIPFG